MKVRLIRKFADRIDGIDLSNHEVDEVIDLPERKAELLLAEGWAVEDRRRRLGGVSNVLAFRRTGDPGQSSRLNEEDVQHAS